MKLKSITPFSLGRVLMLLAIVGPLLGLSLFFPDAMADLVVARLLLIAPAAVVCGIAFYLSTTRLRTSILLIVGILAGWMLAPQVLVNWGRPPSFWEEFRFDLDTVGIFVLGGALVAAVLDYALSLAAKKTKDVALADTA